jgi:hypothetical protein
VVSGEWEGERLSFEWEAGLIKGHLPAIYAIVDIAADNLDRTLTMANGARIRGDLLVHPAGFAYCAAKVLGDFRVDHPNPQPEYDPPPGALA